MKMDNIGRSEDEPEAGLDAVLQAILCRVSLHNNNLSQESVL